MFATAVIVGPGLLGASLGLAIKAHALAKHVVGVGHRQASLDEAVSCGAIDRGVLDFDEALPEADLIVLATPAALVAAHLDAIADRGRAEAIVTDVASTKAAICAHAASLWPGERRFVGSHPLAGSEKFGASYARADFYADSVVLMEPAHAVASDAYEAVSALWQAIGAKTIAMQPNDHDRVLARTSHIPHVSAAALALSLEQLGDVSEFSGNGLRDSTRVADGRPELWRDILLTNRSAILDGINDLMLVLDEFAEALEEDDGDRLLELFGAARDARHAALGQ